MPHVSVLLTAEGRDFVTAPCASLTLTLEGIDGDLHAGAVRAADSRTPWHPRGTRIANTRQLSIVSVEDCAEIALLLDLAEVDPALLGANVVLDGAPGLSLATPGTRLLFASGATIFVTEQNAPCRQPAVKLAAAHERPDLLTRFVSAATGRRGLVGLVEREGVIVPGDEVRVLPSPAHVTVPKVRLEHDRV